MFWSFNCVINLGPIPLFIGSELFRQGPRPKAMAVVGVSLWLATFVIAMGFEPLQVTINVSSYCSRLEQETVA